MFWIRKVLKKVRSAIITARPTGEVTISLVELSQVWLGSSAGYTADDHPAATAPKEDTQEVVPCNKASVNNKVDDLSRYVPQPVFEPFWNEYIIPNIGPFQNDGSLSVLRELVDILTIHGAEPSVVPSETIFTNQAAQDLANVSLQQHSINVALNLLKSQHKVLSDLDFVARIPPMVFAALAHDVGKLSRYVTAVKSSKHDHPIISGRVLEELFAKHNVSPPWRDKVINSVLMHHSDGDKSDFYIDLPLRHADYTARQQELQQVRGGGPRLNGAAWLDVDSLLSEKILPVINLLDKSGSENQFYAFTNKDMVYIRMDWLYEVVKEMYVKAEKGGVARDFCFEYNGNNITDLAKRHIVERLNAQKKLSEGYNYSPANKASHQGKWYIIYSGVYSPAFRLIPIPIKHFGVMPSDLESRKTSWLKTITSVAEKKADKAKGQAGK